MIENNSTDGMNSIHHSFGWGFSMIPQIRSVIQE